MNEVFGCGLITRPAIRFNTKLLISAILIHFRLWITVSRLYKATISKIGAVANSRRDGRDDGATGRREEWEKRAPLSVQLPLSPRRPVAPSPRPSVKARAAAPSNNAAAIPGR